MAQHGVRRRDWSTATARRPGRGGRVAACWPGPPADRGVQRRDACSLGVVPALHERRRTDVALVGFGDFAMADALVPAVTVVDHRARRRPGRGAAPGPAGEPDLPGDLHVPVALVERGSGELRP